MQIFWILSDETLVISYSSTGQILLIESILSISFLAKNIAAEAT